jgi:hypothetical protein
VTSTVLPASAPLALARPLIRNLCLAYLALPLLLFVAFWLRPWLAVGAMAALLFVLKRAFNLTASPGLPSAGPVVPRLRFGTTQMLLLLWCALCALVFCLLTQASATSIQHWDYVKHTALLHNLIDYPWPVIYYDDGNSATILRYTFAYYLPAAGLAKCFGAKLAELFLFGWTFLGVFLFFAFIASLARRWQFALLAVPLVALFSGLDVLHYVAIGGSWQGFQTEVLDAWARTPLSCGWLIGSTPFSFHWTAQHAIGAALGSVILVDAWHDKGFFRIVLPTGVILLLWSPFVALSFGAMAMANLSRRALWADLLSPKNLPLLVLMPLLPLLALFVLADAHAIPRGFCLPQADQALTFFVQYGLFAALEFAILGGLIFWVQKKLPLPVLTALAVLCALMLLRVGANNDLQMRASTLPLFVLALCMLEPLQTPLQTPLRLRSASAALWLTVLLGDVAGAQELFRGGVNWHILGSNWNQPLFDVNWLEDGLNHHVTPQYVARLPQRSWAWRMLRHGRSAFQIQAAGPDLARIHWGAYGKADFDLTSLSVRSLEATEAALISEELHLPAGDYRIEATIDADLVASPGVAQVANLSIPWKKKLISFGSGHLENQVITSHVHLDGKPFQLALALGGAGSGSGMIRLRGLTIARLSQPPGR